MGHAVVCRAILQLLACRFICFPTATMWRCEIGERVIRMAVSLIQLPCNQIHQARFCDGVHLKVGGLQKLPDDSRNL
jgi:hypothetical protein